MFKKCATFRILEFYFEHYLDICIKIYFAFIIFACQWTENMLVIKSYRNRTICIRKRFKIYLQKQISLSFKIKIIVWKIFLSKCSVLLVLSFLWFVFRGYKKNIFLKCIIIATLYEIPFIYLPLILL